METRIAVVGIVVEEEEAVRTVNELLHQYAPYVVGRMGLPYRAKGVNIISVVVDAPENIVSALSGKLGNIKGIGVKSLYAKTSDRKPCQSCWVWTTFPQCISWLTGIMNVRTMELLESVLSLSFLTIAAGSAAIVGSTGQT